MSGHVTRTTLIVTATTANVHRPAYKRTAIHEVISAELQSPQFNANYRN